MTNADKLKHDLNNNIIKLQGMFEILIDGESEFDTDEVVHDARTVLEELNTLLNEFK
ncbi:MAG: hypothetical protein H6621_03365 [Halobacteriovoraceae bacterium]|nr:hypothetical protein [Halobacteriovoraceae bacterium]MCB9094086.1 hypothetical protein [Halobacteriovoraceae bacterium]